MSTKNVNDILKNINEKHFVIFLDNCTHKSIKRIQLNEKKSKISHIGLRRWYWKWKPTWRKDVITYNSNPWILFSFNWLVIIWRGFVWIWTSKVKEFNSKENHPQRSRWFNFKEKYPDEESSHRWFKGFYKFYRIYLQRKTHAAQKYTYH